MESKNSMNLPGNNLSLNPYLLGALYEDGRELQTGTGTLFPGDEKVLGKRELKKRATLARLVQQRLSQILLPQEKILYIVPGLEVPSLMEQLGFGRWWSLYFRVALVFTDKRVIEVLLRSFPFRSSNILDTRTRSFDYQQVKEFKLKGKKITFKFTNARGKKSEVRWTVIGKDKALLSLLLPKIQERFKAGSAGAGQMMVAWHCPECGENLVEHPEQCGKCQVSFRSKKMATLLALLFPGAGLYYVGHSVLATFDMLGEFYLYFICLMLALAYNPGKPEDKFVLFIIPLLFFITKLESVHLSRILVHRSKSIKPTSMPKWKGLAWIGGVCSAFAILIIVGLIAWNENTGEPLLLKEAPQATEATATH